MNAPRTREGALAWDVIQGCRRQLRTSLNGPVGLDFGAVMAVAAARGCASALLAEALPDVELHLLLSIREAAEGGE